MLSRSDAIDAFLASAGWTGATRRPLAGDASFRRYERIATPDGRHAVLMDAPPDKEDVRPFIRVAEYLTTQDYAAPVIFARDEAQGFLLLEDLGDALFNPLIAAQPAMEEQLYQAACDVLLLLAEESSYPKVPNYDDALLLKELRLFSEWYLPRLQGTAITDEAIQEWEALWQGHAFPIARTVPDTLVLRDYHADNLLWLPGREGTARVGLLDFQDAVIGPVTYDLVSLLEDARRDVPQDLAERMRAHVLAGMPELDAEAFRASYAVMGAQRNLKIIGIFTRLAARDGKPHYLDMLRRVWGYLEQDLRHPALAGCRRWLDHYVPAAVRGSISI